MDALKFLLKKLENQWEEEITIKRGDFLARKHSVNTNLYLVLEGSLRVFIEDEEQDHTIRFGYKDSIITALDCFLTNKPTLFYIQSLKKCSLKLISKEKFHRVINKDNDCQKAWNKLLESFVYQQIEREIDLITFSPQKRFQRVFERSPQVFQEIPHKYIASYLRMAPETLSRILKNLD